jgi:DNA-binding transcriptional ArsR family regulator
MDNILGVLKAMSDESRFKIINILLNQDLCVGGLARQLDISEAAVSQHLQVLRRIGVVTGEKRGYYTHYGVNRALLKQLAEKINEIASQSPGCSGGCRRNRTGDCQCCSNIEKDE